MREKVSTTAKELGLDVSMKALETPTHTVADAARAVGCDDAQIAKSLVFVADGDPLVVVASGAHRVNLDSLCETIDCAEIRPATPDEVRAATGFSVGGVPPFGHGLPVVFDESLLEHEFVWAAGGDGCSLLQAAPARLVECTSATVAAIA
ncbi:MAG: YbaK/EbsC family protein [Thermoleophilaceae bacterium]|nr:YbaK/EbsC family protein [Thermoleophilaceae bacterium]